MGVDVGEPGVCVCVGGHCFGVSPFPALPSWYCLLLKHTPVSEDRSMASTTDMRAGRLWRSKGSWVSQDLVIRGQGIITVVGRSG